MDVRALWKKVWRIQRHNVRTYDPLAYRATIKRRLEEDSEGGMIALCRKGHDCDHMHYDTVTHIPTPHVYAWEKEQEEHENWLDGPEMTWFRKPSECPEHSEHRDVAAEMAGY